MASMTAGVKYAQDRIGLGRSAAVFAAMTGKTSAAKSHPASIQRPISIAESMRVPSTRRSRPGPATAKQAAAS
tara:strand:- start:4077 stop:4295 length:219 start_codon:yes stop_codon:yes gene_type:complete